MKITLEINLAATFGRNAKAIVAWSDFNHNTIRDLLGTHQFCRMLRYLFSQATAYIREDELCFSHPGDGILEVSWRSPQNAHHSDVIYGIVKGINDLNTTPSLSDVDAGLKNRFDFHRFQTINQTILVSGELRSLARTHFCEGESLETAKKTIPLS